MHHKSVLRIAGNAGAELHPGWVLGESSPRLVCGVEKVHQGRLSGGGTGELGLEGWVGLFWVIKERKGILVRGNKMS